MYSEGGGLWVEKIAPRKLGYTKFWLMSSIGGFFISQILTIYFGEEPYYIARFIYISVILTFPIIYVRLYKRIVEVLRAIGDTVFHIPDIGEWLDEIIAQHLLLKSKTSKILCGLTTFIIVCFSAISSSLYKTLAMNILAFIALAYIGFICAFGLMELIVFLYALISMSRLQAYLDIYKLKQDEINCLNKIYFQTAIIITAMYLLLQLGAHFTPYSNSIFVLGFLFVLTAVPAAYYFVTFFSVLKISKKAKLLVLDEFDETKVSLLYAQAINDPTQSNILSYKAAIEFRDYLMKYKFKQINLSLILSFAGLLTPLVIQIITIIISKK